MEKDTRPQATDFRIGNIIRYNGNFEFIDSLHSDNTFRIKRGDSSEGCFKTYGIELIYIDEDILLSLGFNKKYTQSFEEYEVECFKYGRLSIGLLSTGDISVYFNDEEIFGLFYLHQLQNLYFALTGEELQNKNKITS